MLYTYLYGLLSYVPLTILCAIGLDDEHSFSFPLAYAYERSAGSNPV